MELNKIYNMDCLDGLKQIESDSIDAIISDPPYQLSSIIKGFSKENGKEAQASSGFMGKEWDVLPTLEILKEGLRVLKSGAWALWVMTPRQDSQLEFLLRLRQAGFNIAFSSIEWVYASGFPKSADLSLLADKKMCKEDLIKRLGRDPTKEEFKESWSKWREVIGKRMDGRYAYSFQKENSPFVVMNKEKGIIANPESIGVETEPYSLEAKALDGSYAGMQLKPARELIIVSQKPTAGKTYLDQALLHLKEPEHNQLGGTWLDDGRIPVINEPIIFTNRKVSYTDYAIRVGGNAGYKKPSILATANPTGRFPANILVSDNALSVYSEGALAPVKAGQKGFGGIIYGKYNQAGDDGKTFYSDKEVDKSISRYFDLDFWFENKLKQLPKEQQKIFPFLYVPKASKSERNEGLENMPDGLHGHGNLGNSAGLERFQTIAKNIHPTVKPIKLMSYLITLTTREGDIVLDPFIGSGTTAVASILLNRKFIGFEREKEYYDIANNRLKKYMEQTNLGEVSNNGN